MPGTDSRPMPGSGVRPQRVQELPGNRRLRPEPGQKGRVIMIGKLIMSATFLLGTTLAGVAFAQDPI
jgi:hypothetical protein